MPEASEGGASSVTADSLSGEGGGTGAGASAFVGTYIEAAYNTAFLNCTHLDGVKKPRQSREQQQLRHVYITCHMYTCTYTRCYRDVQYMSKALQLRWQASQLTDVNCTLTHGEQDRTGCCRVLTFL